MTLKLRFLLAFAVHTLGVLGLFGGTYYVLEKRAAVQSQHRLQRRTVEEVGSACGQAFLASTAIMALNHIELVQKDPSVVFAACLSLEGRVEAASDPAWLGGRREDPAAKAALASEKPGFESYRNDASLRVRSWHAPVQVEGRRVGTARVGFDEARLEAEVDGKLWATLRQLGRVSATTLALALLVSLVLSASLTRPITQLAQAAREIGAGRLEYRAPTANRSDELGFLGREINEMAGRLAELDNLKQSFVAMITHDLKSPLTAISGYATLMSQGIGGAPSPKHAEYLNVMQQAAGLLGQYVEDILDVSKLEAGQFKLDVSTVEPAALAEAVVRVQTGSAARYGVRLEAAAAPGLRAMRGDAKQLERVIANLVGNALKFSPDGGTVRVAVAPSDGGGVRFEVADGGPGIPEKALRTIFDKFSQVGETRHLARHGGTGLGLTIVKQIVEAHGGKVWAENLPERGARFVVVLPAAPPAA